MDFSQWENLKRSGAYRRKVLKAYRRIVQLDVTQNNSTQQILSGPNNNSNIDCEGNSTDVNNVKIVLVKENEGSVEEKKLDTENDNFDFNCKRFVDENEGSVEKNKLDTKDVTNDFSSKMSSDSYEEDGNESEDDKKIKNSITKNNDIIDFRYKIRAWAQQHNISHTALRSLALLLNDRTPNLLPVDPRSIMNTPRNIITTSVEPGEYWHNGLMGPLTKILEKFAERCDTFSLCFNIDGLPVCNSSKQQFWPILCSIFEKPELKPFIVGIYAGHGKPKDVNQFLSPFVEEMNKLLEIGLNIEKKKKCITVKCFVCDSPARAMIKGVCNFNGKHGCNKCTTIGEYSHISHTVIFPDIDKPLRNNEDFRKKLYGAHHKFDSVLLDLPIDMIEAFPVSDALHLIDLGIMKRLLIGWRDGNFSKKDTKWSANQFQCVNNFLNACKTPAEIHRSIRNLDHLSHWKGSEFRTCFLYLSVVILPEVLSRNAMTHFLTLFCAVIICSNETYFKFLLLAKDLLRHFVNNYKVFYGIHHITSNIHNLSHVVDEVQRFGILQSFDAYKFENKLHVIKKMLRQGNKPLSQVAKRLGEFNDIDLKEIAESPNREYPYVKENKKSRMLVLHFKNFVLSAKSTDKYFLTNGKEIMQIKSIMVREKRNCIICFQLTNTEDIFDLPIKSSLLNVLKCKVCDESRMEIIRFPEDVNCKLFGVEYKSELYLLPLLHTL